MSRRKAPPTAEGWYVLHDFRTIAWDDWRDAPQRTRDAALKEGQKHLEDAVSVADAQEGTSALYGVLGQEADLMFVHLRPTTAALDHLERAFEQTTLARFTERTDSFVSVTEASGYSERAREFFDGDLDESSGLAKYMRSRIEPDIPDAEHVSFYPMDKRREPEYNWYDLPFEERAEHMDAHGDIGRDYAGKVTQMISSAIGLDDWEWGVTLWADDLTDVKDLLYEMRFDPSSSKYAEFGPFTIGRRLAPADLDAYLAGDAIAPETGETAEGQAAPATPADAVEHDGDTSGHPHGKATDDGHPHAEQASESDDPHAEPEDDGDSGHPGGGSRPDVSDSEYATVDDLEQRLFQLGIREGADYEGGEYGLLFYSNVDAQELAEDVAGLRENFDHYDRHVATVVRASSGRSAVASLWTAEDAAETAAGFLGDLPGIDERYGGVLDSHEASSAQDSTTDDGTDTASEAIRRELAEHDVYAGQPHGEDVYALVVYSTAGIESLMSDVAELRETFRADDAHIETAVYETGPGEVAAVDDTEPTAVVSRWETESAAQAAGDALADLPEVVGRAGEGEGFGTMGMFYTVKSEYREEFLETFETVGETLGTMDGHYGTALLVNHENENDMFIASNWASREDAMAFFRSEDFRDTVEWGREVLADRPRHVFLA
ncbi:heme-binding protein [Halorhabdus sp. CBA1104]|uniref:heme-binding protein n=1 Tax=unclassified Halorhabdus TaxID=2621901 RepID=UPI0012B328FB|nr:MULTISPECIES: heme-binding protein [unclassified Halorhabdus]QGN06349.1 heme-binding protein [Halorhabdus sp. CBA1104]